MLRMLPRVVDPASLVEYSGTYLVLPGTLNFFLVHTYGLLTALMCFRRPGLLGIVGHSGCGKTSLLNVLSGRFAERGCGGHKQRFVQTPRRCVVPRSACITE